MNFEETLDKIDELVIALFENKKSMGNTISGVDKEISQLYHDIETNTFNIFSGYKFLVKLQVQLRARRNLKTELAKVQSATSHCGGIRKKIKKAKAKIRQINKTLKPIEKEVAYNCSAMTAENKVG